jgi:hypothetical protein
MMPSSSQMNRQEAGLDVHVANTVAGPVEAASRATAKLHSVALVIGTMRILASDRLAACGHVGCISRMNAMLAAANVLIHSGMVTTTMNSTMPRDNYGGRRRRRVTSTEV